ncbi:unnamed protein product [Protopolystoma xenopodis]|uniref:Uncharacterized protein n=1 Tax=Protopolystoma xenopodis TaxID=117903 RepID=A0A448WE04_9PLAT|nr:unnamed protein product [Protopolystoma xenopodis]
MAVVPDRRTALQERLSILEKNRRLIQETLTRMHQLLQHWRRQRHRSYRFCCRHKYRHPMHHHRHQHQKESTRHSASPSCLEPATTSCSGEPSCEIGPQADWASSDQLTSNFHQTACHLVSPSLSLSASVATTNIGPQSSGIDSPKRASICIFSCRCQPCNSLPGPSPDDRMSHSSPQDRVPCSLVEGPTSKTLSVKILSDTDSLESKQKGDIALLPTYGLSNG